MSILDFHNHYYPPEYLREVENGPSTVRVTFDAEANPVLHYPGDYNVIVPGHRDIEFRQGVLERADIDRQLLTFTSPGTHVESPDRAVRLARQVNDVLATIARERSGRFSALGTLPLNDPAASVQELERVSDELGLPGCMVFSNVNGTSLSDKCYWPLYEAANARGCVLYIHPIHPLGVEAMTEYWLMPLVGFPMDTTLAAAHLVFSGVPETFPNIRWVLGHLGGAIPFLAERLDRGYEAFSECRQSIGKLPSTYLKKFFYDTVNFDPAALKLALEFAGEDQILAGSDYPHQIGSLKSMVSSIDALDASPSVKDKILGQNAQRLLGLD